MKKIVIAALLTMLYAGLAHATCDPLFIGMFTDPEGDVCYADIVTYQEFSFQIMAYISDEFEAVTAAEFRVEDWIGNPGYPTAQVDVEWNTTLVIGTIDYGVALAFQTPVPGPFALLGTVTMTVFDDQFIGEYQEMRVSHTLDSNTLAVVDENFVTHDQWIDGGAFTFNCPDPLFCWCIVRYTPTEPTSWGSLKALY